MRSMPLKPLKRTRIERSGGGLFRFTLLSKIRDAEAFRRILEDDFETCLAGADAVVESDLGTKSLTLRIDDIEAFKTRLRRKLYLFEGE